MLFSVVQCIRQADVPTGAAISLSWDFPPKVQVTFFRILGKWKCRAEACSGDNVGVQTTFLKGNL